MYYTTPLKYGNIMALTSCSYSYGNVDDMVIKSMEDSIKAVEYLLNYTFKNKKLIENALTHPSYSEAESYQVLEFVGDSALGHAVTMYSYLNFPGLDQGQLSMLRAANISTEKLARVAVKNKLYLYVRHNAVGLDEKVSEFATAVEKEDDSVVYGGVMKAPKVLADIVESVAAAVYIDCGVDLNFVWKIFRDLLEPIITLDMLNEQPQPVTTLFEVCQKDGKQVDIKHIRKGEKNIASVYVDGQFVASSSSGQKDNARLHAAEAALAKLSQHVTNDNTSTEVYSDAKGPEIEGAKQKLHELCGKKRWAKPIYSIRNELGPSHDKKYVCGVQIETTEGILYISGGKRSRVKEAESSAASIMISGLMESKDI